ncbi:hypothetical protein PAXRUDRAFT_14715 [Paxillus rubicundulus Ve08.2h10]|uniref:Unplaced genomic scaffold scaffold_800, whole genome shotgun sequence n=1 Tax=Paxillus rubicundulus Ve08.2h10 TaxID=930991 RepID=A0A0D0D372_9AGAM|nr:hypothetical protein PAXRUDRAFT_14715 [Paxillus rubicundulus Ve08.2h10]
MSSSATNNLTKWSNEQLCKNEDNDKNELDEKKSMEHRHHIKVQKEAEHQRAEEEMRWKAEEEVKRKMEVEAQRRVEAEAKACAEELQSRQGPSPMLWVLRCWGGMRDESSQRCEQPGDTQPMQQRKWEEVMSPQARKKKVWTQSLVADKEEEEDEEAEGVGEDCDILGALTKVLAMVVTEMWDMAADRRCVAAESHVQTEWMLGILEEIWGCLDPEFSPEEPEVGLEEEFEEEEVVEVTKEREALKGWSKEEAEVDESV